MGKKEEGRNTTSCVSLECISEHDTSLLKQFHSQGYTCFNIKQMDLCEDSLPLSLYINNSIVACM